MNCEDNICITSSSLVACVSHGFSEPKRFTFLRNSRNKGLHNQTVNASVISPIIGKGKPPSERADGFSVSFTRALVLPSVIFTSITVFLYEKETPSRILGL